MSDNGRRTLHELGFPLPFLLLPALVEMLPFSLRIAVVLAAGAAGAYGWVVRSSWGASLITSSIAAGWISLASYPAALSLWPQIPVFSVLIAGVWLPHVWRRPVAPPVVRIIPMILGLWILFTPTARRYDVDALHPELIELAEDLTSPADLTRFVHEQIERRPAPPTDTALDTWRRKRGHCGAMSNLLHKLLLYRDWQASILHLKGDRGGLHTLVWIQTETESMLADPQHNEVRSLDPGDLIQTSPPPDDWPKNWKGQTRAWIHKPGRGYIPYKP